MKNIILFFFFSLILSLTAFSQVEEVKYDNNNLYHNALSAVLEKRLNDYGNNTDTKENLLNTTILMKNSNINLPNRIGNFRIDYLGSIAFDNKYKEFKNNNNNGDQMPFMEIFSMVNNGLKLQISFSKLNYSRKGDRDFIAYEGGARVVFVYDCKTEKFKIENVELWGV